VSQVRALFKAPFLFSANASQAKTALFKGFFTVLIDWIQVPISVYFAAFARIIAHIWISQGTDREFYFLRSILMDMENDLDHQKEFCVPWKRLDHRGMFLSANRYLTMALFARIGILVSLVLSLFQVWFLACTSGFFLLFVLVRLLVHFDLGGVDESISLALHSSEKIWLMQGESRFACSLVSDSPFPFKGGLVLRCGDVFLILSDKAVVVKQKHRCAGIMADDLRIRMDAVMKKEEGMLAKDAHIVTAGDHPVCLYGRIRLSSVYCQFSLLYSHME
jgi:hypothetical protein